MLASVRLVSLLLALCLLLGACARPGVTRILLVCIERLPAERVGAYGARPSPTPVLDRLAAEGVRFETVIAPALWDRPAHASLLTGQDPPRHGVRSDAAGLPAELPTLPGSARARGLVSVAVFSPPRLSAHPLMSDLDHALVAGPGGGEVVDRAIAWLDQAPPRYLLALHLGSREGSGPRSTQEIARLDAELGRFLAAFDARPTRGESLVVVTSARAADPLVGRALRDADLRVPLVLAGMGLPAGRVVESPVRLVDVAPTLVTLARLPGLRDVDGRSLMPFIAGRRMAWPYAYAESGGAAPRVALRTPSHKYVRGERPALYDLAADPEERRDVAGQHPEIVERLEALLAARIAGSGERGGAAARPRGSM